MASTDWLCLGGVEISNAARVIAYADNGVKPNTTSIQDTACPDLRLFLGDGEYRTPLLDPAPWIDHNDPCSYDFAGLLVTNITGLDAAPRERSVTDRIGDGAVLGRRRRPPRVINVEGVLVASTCCGVAYGMRWLASALDGRLPCGPGAGCEGDDLTYMVCCPEVCEDSPDFTSYEDCASTVFRTMREVACTGGPEVTGRAGGACGCCNCPLLTMVSFQLTAGRPHALRPPVTVVEDATWTAADPSLGCVEWSTDPDCVPEEIVCAEAAAADGWLVDPKCPPPDPLPTLPMPVNPCACQPLTRRRKCVPVPASASTAAADLVTDLQLFAGDGPLRSIRIRVYPNPLDRPVDDLDECGYCSEINVSYLPPYATLRLDGTRQRAVVSGPGRDEVPAYGVLSGPAGRAFTWPVMECAIPHLVCVEVDEATLSPDSTVTLHVVGREV